MKRFLTLFLTFILFLSLLSTASCGSKHPIEKFYQKIEKSDNNYQISCSLTEKSTSSRFVITIQVDGNVQYMPENIDLGIDEIYTEYIDDYEISYTKNAKGEWKKSLDELSEDNAFNFDNDDIFNADNYEKIKGEKNSYRQKKDVIFQNFENVIMTIAKDSCTLECQMITDGIVVDAKIVISKLGEMKLTLPNVN